MTEGSAAGQKRSPVHLRRDEYAIFGLLAAVLTLGAAVLSIVGTQLLPLLTARGIGVSAAVAFGAIVGPAQVGARVIELLVGNRYDPVWTIVASATLVATSALMLTLGLPIVALAIALYGAGNGIGSVARGTVPLALFGAERYAVLMGRLGFPLLVAMALSPYLGGLAFQKGGAEWTLLLLTCLQSRMSFWWERCGWLRGRNRIVAFGPNRQELTRRLTSELPPITDMVRPRGNALRLPSAAKSLSVFGKKSQMVRRDFSSAVPHSTTLFVVAPQLALCC
jgi:hypothetical protein